MWTRMEQWISVKHQQYPKSKMMDNKCSWRSETIKLFLCFDHNFLKFLILNCNSCHFGRRDFNLPMNEIAFEWTNCKYKNNIFFSSFKRMRTNCFDPIVELNFWEILLCIQKQVEISIIFFLSKNLTRPASLSIWKFLYPICCCLLSKFPELT